MLVSNRLVVHIVLCPEKGIRYYRLKISNKNFLENACAGVGRIWSPVPPYAVYGDTGMGLIDGTRCLTIVFDIATFL
jgi:hypothetical protein